jgi:hypothetical protein
MTNPGRGADDSTLAQFDKILTDAQSIFDRMNRVLLEAHKPTGTVPRVDASMPMSPVRLHGKVFAVVEGNASTVPPLPITCVTRRAADPRRRGLGEPATHKCLPPWASGKALRPPCQRSTTTQPAAIPRRGSGAGDPPSPSSTRATPSRFI